MAGFFFRSHPFFIALATGGNDKTQRSRLASSKRRRHSASYSGLNC